MRLTASGAYPLPGPLYRTVGNCVLRAAVLVPRSVRARYLARSSFYQVSGDDATGDFQGVSAKKWEALQMPSSLAGKSVLDIGCSEGFFAQRCAERGAAPVLGVDGSLGRLLAARFISVRDGLDVRYKVGVFPGVKFRGAFDYVLCLSVLHHLLVNKDVWKVLSDQRYAEDRDVLRCQFALLRKLTALGGKCIVEVPYEYDDPVEERKSVDFGLLGNEMINAGFAGFRCLGTWDYNPAHRQFKDRIIYVAEA